MESQPEFKVIEVANITKPENVNLILTFPDNFDLKQKKDELILSKKELGSIENAIKNAVEIGCNIISETKYKWYFKKYGEFEETLVRFFRKSVYSKKGWNKCYLISSN